jgi:hypothetical protein
MFLLDLPVENDLAIFFKFLPWPLEPTWRIMVQYSQIANNRIAMIKGQDIVVLAALMGGDRHPRSYAPLAKRAKLSVSETHAAVKRLQDAMLVDEDRHLRKRNAVEFLTHAIRYVFPPVVANSKAIGMPTGYAAPVATAEFATSGDVPVWPCEGGTVEGRAFEPVYSSAPSAAAADNDIYDALAIIDMLRGGRLRERAFAEQKLKELMK